MWSGGHTLQLGNSHSHSYSRSLARSAAVPTPRGLPPPTARSPLPSPPTPRSRQGTTTDPAPLAPGQQPLPPLSEPSGLMSEDHIRALSAAVPARYRQASWTLLYATARDGISLQVSRCRVARLQPMRCSSAPPCRLPVPLQTLLRTLRTLRTLPGEPAGITAALACCCLPTCPCRPCCATPPGGRPRCWWCGTSTGASAAVVLQQQQLYCF